jgi:hypothetical protein
MVACAAFTPSIAHADGAAPATASALEREQATTLFVRAKEQFDQKNFKEAIEGFRASLAVINSPNTRLYIGRCLRELGNAQQAYVEFGRVANEAREAAASDGRYTLTADEATQERDAVAPFLGFVTIELRGADDSIKLRVSGQEMGTLASRDPLPVTPGAIEIVVERDGVPVARRGLSMTAGEHVSLAIDVPPRPPAPPPSVHKEPPPREDQTPKTLRTLSFVAGGIGIAGLATFAIAGAVTKSTYDDLDTRCGGSRCLQDSSDDISRGVTTQTIANVGLVVGAVGIVGGVTLFLLSTKGDNKKTASVPSTLTLAATGNGALLRGQF